MTDYDWEFQINALWETLFPMLYGVCIDLAIVAALPFQH